MHFYLIIFLLMTVNNFLVVKYAIRFTLYLTSKLLVMNIYIYLFHVYSTSGGN